MTHIARYVAVVLAVSTVAHAGVAAGVVGDTEASSVDDIGQQLGGLADLDAADRVVSEADSTARQALGAAAAAEPILPVEPVGLVACYSRYDTSDPLEHATREELHETVASAPGQSVTTVARTVGVPVSTARYHLRVLEGEGLLDRHRIDGRARLYPADFGDDPELAAALTASAPSAVVDAVRTAAPLTVTALATKAEIAPSTASYHVGRLTDAGVFERERDGKTVRVSLSADAARLLGDRPEGNHG